MIGFLLTLFMLSQPDTTRLYYLEDIFITASREYFTLRYTASSVTEIDSALLGFRNTRIPASIIDVLPSVRIERTTKGALRAPSIRGHNASEILVMLDGIPMNTGFANWGNVVSFPVSDIKKIEITGGTNTVVYGPNALGGVVNILTNTKSGTNLSGELNIGSFNTKRLSASLKGFDHKFAFNVFKESSDGYMPNTDFNALHLTSTGRFRLGKSDVSLNAGYVDANAGIPIAPNTPQRIDFWRGFRGSIISETKINQRLLISLKGYMNTERYRILIFKDTTFNEIKKDLLNDGKTVGAELINNYLFSTKHLLTFGLQGKLDNVDFAYVGGKRNASTFGAFLQDVSVLNKAITFNFGIRSDWHSISGQRTNYNIGTIIKVTPMLVARLNFGTGKRFPAIRELYMTEPAPGRGNTNLKSETSKSIEASISTSETLNHRIRITAFATHVKNLIERDLTKTPWEFANLKEVDLNGLEIEYKGRIMNWAALFLNFSYLKATDLENSERLNFRPKYKANAGLDFNLSKVKLKIMEQYVGEQSYKAKNPNTGQKETKNINPYFLTHLKFNLKVWSGITLMVSIENLTDANYEIEAHQQALPVISGKPRSIEVGILFSAY